MLLEILAVTVFFVLPFALMIGLLGKGVEYVEGRWPAWFYVAFVGGMFLVPLLVIVGFARWFPSL
jgi:hypothetical protein